MPTQRELLTALVQTCSSGTTPQARDVRLRTMTTILGTLVKLANNLTVQENTILEKHRTLRTTNNKLRSALSLDDTNVAPHVQHILHAMGYCVTTPDAGLLHYTSKDSLSATWKFELDRSLGAVRSKSVIAMREIMHKVGESASTTTTTTSSSSSSNLRSKSSPPKLKGPHVQIKCNNKIYMIPLSEEDTGKTITGAQLKEKVAVAMGNVAGGKNVVTSSLKLIKKGKVIADADELSTSKKYKIKVMIQASEEEKKETQRASAHSQQKERNDRANGVGTVVAEPKLSFEQQQDLMKMMSMGMAPPPGKLLYFLVHSFCCGFLLFFFFLLLPSLSCVYTCMYYILYT